MKNITSFVTLCDLLINAQENYYPSDQIFFDKGGILMRILCYPMKMYNKDKLDKFCINYLTLIFQFSQTLTNNTEISGKHNI